MPSFLSRLQQMAPERRQVTLRHLATHLVEAGQARRLIHLLTSFDFLAAKVAGLSPQPLVDDYALALRSGLLTGSSSAGTLQSLQDAVRLSAIGLEQDATQLAGQLYGRLLASEDEEVQALLLRAAQAQRGPWLRPLSQTLAPPGALLRTVELVETYNVPYCVVPLPNGEQALTGWLDGRLRLLELETGSILLTFGDHEGAVRAVAVAPDGAWAVSASEDKTVRVWDLERGLHMGQLAGLQAAVKDLTLLSGGDRLLTGCEDRTLRLWHLPSRRLLWATKTGEDVESVATDPDGRYVFAALNDGTVKMWSAAKGGRAVKVFRGHRGPVQALAISGDGTRMVTGAADQTVRLWDLKARVEQRVFEGHKTWVNAVALSPDGHHAVSAGGIFLDPLTDNSIYLWDLEAGRRVGIATGHTSDVYEVAVSADGRRIVSASRDGTVKVWDADRIVGTTPVPTHAGPVTAVALVPQDASHGRAISASRDSTLKIWDLETAAECATLSAHSLPVNALAISRDGKRLVSAAGLYEEPPDAGHTLRVWDVQSWQEINTLTGHTNAVTSVALSPDGQRAVSSSYDRTVRAWDLEQGVTLYTLHHVEEVLDVAVTPDGQLGISAVGGLAARGYPLMVWQLASGETLFELAGHEDRINQVAVTSDSSYAISASSDHTLMVWDLGTGKRVAHLRGHGDEVFALAVASDGRRVVSGSADNTLRVWDLQSGGEMHMLVGHEDTISDVVTSRDGRYAVATSSDGFLSVWDLSDARLVARFRGDSWLSACAIADDGQTIVCGEGSGRVHVLKLEGC